PWTRWLSIRLRDIELRTMEWLRIIDERRTLRGAKMVADGKSPALRPLLHPLRFSPLAGDHRDRVRRRGRILGREDTVEQNKPAGILPKKWNGIAIDMRHHETRELRPQSLVRGAPFCRETVVFVERELIHRGDIAKDVELSRQANMAVIDAVIDIAFSSGPIRKGSTLTVSPLARFL